MHDHEATRAWYSAHRDGEAPPGRGQELRACADCSAWAAALDEVERAIVADGVPDVAGAALAAWDGASRRSRVPARNRPARVLLGVAGASGIVLALVSLLALPGSAAAAHLGRDLLGFQAVFAVGFLLASADPARYGRALLPLTAAASVVVLLPSAAAAATSDVGLLAEASHLPVLLGLVGLLLLLDARTGRSRPRLA